MQRRISLAVELYARVLGLVAQEPRQGPRYLHLASLAAATTTSSSSPPASSSPSFAFTPLAAPTRGVAGVERFVLQREPRYVLGAYVHAVAGVAVVGHCAARPEGAVLPLLLMLLMLLMLLREAGASHGGRYEACECQ